MIHLLRAVHRHSRPLVRIAEYPRRDRSTWSRHCGRQPTPRPGRGDASVAGGLFQEISGVGNAFGGCRHLSGDLTGAGGILRSKDGAQVGDQ